MMVIEDIVINFAVSLAANTVPGIISMIKGSKTLGGRIDGHFRKALDKWKMPQKTRDEMKFDSIKFYSDLERYLKNPAQGIHPKVRELIQLWVTEMQSDTICYEFIISRQLDFANNNLNKLIAAVKDEQTSIDDMRQEVHYTAEGVKRIIDLLDKSGSEDILVPKIEGILNGVVISLIESLKLDSARRVICEIETQFSKIIDETASLRALICFRKAQTLMFTSRKSAFELIHTSYTLEPANEEYICNEILRLTYNKDYVSAKKLAEKLPGELKYYHLVEVLNAEDKKTAYESIPNDLKNDYDFKELLYERFCGDSSLDDTFLFLDEPIVTPPTFTFSTLNSWIFAATFARTKSQNFLFLSFEAPQIESIRPYQKVIEEFYNNLSQTEVRDSFPVVKAIYCYWKYITTRDQYWLNEFQKLDKKQFGAQRSLFGMVESSMLLLANRYEEAFTVVSSINAPVEVSYIRYIIRMSSISNNILQLQWILDKVKEVHMKLDSDVALDIAHSITKERAQKTKNIISDNKFVNPTDKALLIQLCDFYDGNEIDISTFKNEVETLGDEMKAYAANILAANGDAKFAFEMLNPIVDETIPDFKRSVYLSILDSMVEKKPELYNILVKNRKQGNYCDDYILDKEFQLDTKISDYKNALEAITELYHRHPNSVSIFANYLFTLGHVHPDQLSQYENKALSIYSEDTNVSVLIYQAFSTNGYLKTAAEFLYRATKASDDQKLRTFFYTETSMGLIKSVAREEKDVSNEGDFVLCDIDGKRGFYKATEFGAPIGKAVMGVAKDDKFETELASKPVALTIIGVFNKYYKLASDIMHDAQDGSNPGLVPFTIDTERPLESLEEFLRKSSGVSQTPRERMMKAYADYENGKVPLLTLVNDNNPLASYYKLLFTSFKMHVNCSIIEIQQMPKPNADSVFILDVPTIITFAEFTAKTGLKITGSMTVTTIQMDLIDTTNKSIEQFLEPDFYEAMNSGYLVKYSDYVDNDAQIHVQKLAGWIQNNCNIIVPDAALLLAENGDDSAKYRLMGSMAMLTKPEYYYVTDDVNIKKMMPHPKIIGSETFVKYFNNEVVSKAYSQFLFECHFQGVDLNESYICKEYEKLEHGEDNRMVDIVQNMNINPYLITTALNCCIILAGKEINKTLFKLTFTNMFVMALKGFSHDYRHKLYRLINENFSFPLYTIQFTLACLHDAMLIANNEKITET